MKISMPVKVAGFFFLFIALILLGLWMNLWLVSRVALKVSSVVTEVGEMRRVSETRVLFRTYVIEISDYIHSGDSKDKAVLEASGLDVARRLEGLVSNLEGSPVGKKTALGIRVDYGKYQGLVAEVIRLYESGRRKEALELEWHGLHPIESVVDSGFERLIMLEASEAESSAKEVASIAGYGALISPVRGLARMADDVSTEAKGLQVLFSAEAGFLSELDGLAHFFSSGGRTAFDSVEAEGRVFEEKVRAYYAFVRASDRSSLIDDVLVRHHAMMEDARALGRGLASGLSDEMLLPQKDRIAAAGAEIKTLLDGQISADSSDMEELLDHINLSKAVTVQTTRYLAANMAVFFLLSGGILFSVLYRDASSIRKLTQGVSSIAAGVYGRKVKVPSGGEIGELASSINNMSERIVEQTDLVRQANRDLLADREARRRVEERLAESEAKYKSLVERLPAVTYQASIDETATILYISPQVEPMLGYTVDEWMTVPALRPRLLHPEDKERVLAEYLESGKDKRPFNAEYRITRKDGSFIWVRDEAVVVEDERGAPLFAQGFFFDITEHVRAEADKRELEVLKETERINRELNDFAHIVSHDLKAPLRAISSLATWLAEDHAEALGPEGREQLSMLIKRVRRMDGLIEGILRYSRVSREKKHREAVDTGKAARDAAEMISAQASVRIVINDVMPVVRADPVQIAQVFQNLISNAVKYMDKPDGVIEVGCGEKNGAYEFYVKDNGPGIDERHFERIFQIFQTLNARDNLESTGVGLSIVKKIIEGEGGRVRVESELGAGSTFYFTLPVEMSA